MKVKFSKSADFIPTWRGNRDLPSAEQIKVKLQPMKFADLMVVMDALGGAKAVQQGGNAEDMVANVNLPKVIADTADLISKYAEISGLDNDDGPVSMEDIVSYPLFSGLVFEILTQLSSLSMVGEEAEGNSAGQPG